MLVQITDCHVTRAGAASIEALEQVVAGIVALPIAPAAVLISGDIVHEGTREDYALVQELLEPLTSPIYAIPGNHDDPALVHEAFGDPGEVEVAGARLVLCNTHRPGTDAGSIDLDALAARLEGDDRPTVVAMHHPPLRTGIPAIDDLALPLEERVALAELLAASPQVALVVCGHVHRTTFETLSGCGVFTCPATWEQIEPAAEFGQLAFVERGRAFAIHTWLHGRFVTQLQPV